MEQNAIGEHTAQESYPGVSFLKNFWCLYLLGEEVGGADTQYKGVLGLIVLLLGGTLDVTLLGGFLVQEKHLIIDEITDHRRQRMF